MTEAHGIRGITSILIAKYKKENYMKYEKSQRVFVCCGQYIALTNAIKDKQIKCPRCGNILKTPIEYPQIMIVKYV